MYSAYYCVWESQMGLCSHLEFVIPWWFPTVHSWSWFLQNGVPFYPFSFSHLFLVVPYLSRSADLLI